MISQSLKELLTWIGDDCVDHCTQLRANMIKIAQQIDQLVQDHELIQQQYAQDIIDGKLVDDDNRSVKCMILLIKKLYQNQVQQKKNMINHQSDSSGNQKNRQTVCSRLQMRLRSHSTLSITRPKEIMGGSEPNKTNQTCLYRTCILETSVLWLLNIVDI